jgi:hypothetical protein
MMDQVIELYHPLPSARALKSLCPAQVLDQSKVRHYANI